MCQHEFPRCADLASRAIRALRGRLCSFVETSSTKWDWNNVVRSPPPAARTDCCTRMRNGIFAMSTGDQHRPSSSDRHGAEGYVWPPRRAHGLRTYGPRLVLQGKRCACVHS